MSLSLERRPLCGRVPLESCWRNDIQASEVDGAASEPAVAGPYPARRFHAPTSHDVRILSRELDSCSRPLTAKACCFHGERGPSVAEPA